MPMYTREQVMEKVRKVLEVAKKTTFEAESQTAYAMAKKLMAEYNLSELDLGEAAEAAGMKSTVTRSKVDVATKGSPWKTNLADILAKHFRCMTFYRYDYTGKKKGQEADQIIMFLGREEDIEIATAVYMAAVATIEKMSKKFRAERRRELRADGSYWGKEGSRAANLSWISGYVDGIQEKLEQMAEDLVKENSRYALVVVVPDEVTKAAQEMGLIATPEQIATWEREQEERRIRREAEMARINADPKLKAAFDKAAAERLKKLMKGFKMPKTKKSEMFDPEAYEKGKEKGKQFDPNKK